MAASYKVAITREITDALKKVFTSSYSVPLLRNIQVGPEFQFVKESFPSIIIVFNERTLRNLGLGHHAVGISDARLGHWYFQGSVVFNCFALTSFDRDTMSDNILDVIAFGAQNSTTQVFHDEITDNDWISLTLMKDNAYPSGDSSLVVPWGASNELLYHTSYTFDVTGEFYSDPQSTSLVQLSQVNHYPYRPEQSVSSGSADTAPWV